MAWWILPPEDQPAPSNWVPPPDPPKTDSEFRQTSQEMQGSSIEGGEIWTPSSTPGRERVRLSASQTPNATWIGTTSVDAYLESFHPSDTRTPTSGSGSVLVDFGYTLDGANPDTSNLRLTAYAPDDANAFVPLANNYARLWLFSSSNRSEARFDLDNAGALLRIYPGPGAGVTLDGATSAPDLLYTVVKSADETVTNSAVLQNDNDLLFPVGANETWVFECILFVTASVNTSDIEITFTGPAGSSGKWGGFGQNATEANLLLSPPLGASLNYGAGTNERIIQLTGTIVNGGTAGNLQLQWCQDTAGAGTSTTVQDMSYIKATRVS